MLQGEHSAILSTFIRLPFAGFSRTQDIASLTLKNELGTPKKLSCASFGTRNNLWRSEERINDYVFKSNSCIKFSKTHFWFCNLFTVKSILGIFFFLQQATSHKSIRKGKFPPYFLTEICKFIILTHLHNSCKISFKCNGSLKSILSEKRSTLIPCPNILVLGAWALLFQ